MGRSPCCDKVGLKKGPWTPEEDQKLLAYIKEHGHGSWRALPAKAGLQRCGKSCRLRWTNYLRPDIKRGKFSLQEEQTIIQLHALLGNRWSAIATHLPKRTDNEIKNYWNTHLKKRLAKMGIDPVTHKPKNDALFSGEGQSKSVANLSHMAQWESARLEAEARLVRESKLRPQLRNTSPNSHPPPSYKNNNVQVSASTSNQPPRSLDILNVWNNNSRIVWSSKISDHHNTIGGGLNIRIGSDLESPTSTLTISENAPRLPPILHMVNSATSVGVGGGSESQIPIIEFVGTSGNSSETTILKDGHHQVDDLHANSISFTSILQDQMPIAIDKGWTPEFLTSNASTRLGHNIGSVVEEGFTSHLLSDSAKEINSKNISDGNGRSGSEDYYEDNKNYWSSILNLVNSSPSESPMF